MFILAWSGEFTEDTFDRIIEDNDIDVLEYFDSDPTDIDSLHSCGCDTNADGLRCDYHRVISNHCDDCSCGPIDIGDENLNDTFDDDFDEELDNWSFNDDAYSSVLVIMPPSYSQEDWHELLASEKHEHTRRARVLKGRRNHSTRRPRRENWKNGGTTLEAFTRMKNVHVD